MELEVDSVALVTEPAAGDDSHDPTVAPAVASAGVTRMPLTEALALGPAAWDAVLARADSPSPFMSWAWHRAWAEAAPATDVDTSEVLVLGGPGGSVEALLPIGLRRVRFHRVPVAALTWAIGDLGCPDHLDVPAAPATDVEALVPVLETLPWQVFILSNLTPDAGIARRLSEAFAERGYGVRRRPLWGCPYLDLPRDWESYLASLTATRRQTVGRKERSLRRRYAVAITDYEGERFEEGWRRLVSLHERRWNGAGALHLPQDAQLQRSFAAELAAGAQLWLTTLDLDGEPVAAWYGFTYRDTVYFYQSGRDPRRDRDSVGMVLMGTMIRRAIERGYRRFDFLRGEDPYKRHWTGTKRNTEEVTVFRPGWRGQALRALDAAAGVRARLRLAAPAIAPEEPDHG